MAIPNNVVRVSMIWKPPSAWSTETAINTFHMQQQTGPSGLSPDIQYVADQVAAKLTANWSGVEGLHSSSVEVTGIKAYLLDTTGHTTAEGSHSFASGTLPGGAAGSVMPPEVAVVLSEYAYLPGSFAPQKGRRRGRMFLPYIGPANMGTNGKLTSGVPSSTASGWATVFNAFNTIESASGRTDPMGVVVLSKAASATFEVLHVACDDHFDVQRRRQHQDTPVVSVSDVTAW